jgi:hypothetical protein
MGPIPLGDSHNFGKRVLYLGDNLIFKPRNLFWEWSLLSVSSPVRLLVNSIFETSGVESPFAILPKLEFPDIESINEVSKLRVEGRVKRLILHSPNNASFTLIDFERMGCAIALLLWFGVSDLHNENIVLGIDNEGHAVFGPIDIEGIFDDLYLPSQSHLLPSSEMAWADAGLLKIKNFLIEFGANEIVPVILYGFVCALSILQGNEREIIRKLDSLLSLSITPSRIVLRPTREYYQWLNGSEFKDELLDLLPSERASLNRNEIPYFYRFLSETDVRYLESPHHEAKVDPENSKVKRAVHHARVWEPGGITKRNNFEYLKKVGSLQLARSLISDGINTCRFAYKSCSVSLTPTELRLVCSHSENDCVSVQCKRASTRPVRIGCGR